MTTNEWLETDGLGGFASGGADTIRTRRYHAILLAAQTPPTGRVVLVNGFDAWVKTESGTYAISSQRYLPDVIHPDGHLRIQSFKTNPWPTWVFKLEDGTQIQQEILMKKGSPTTTIRWSVVNRPKNAQLSIRPFFSGRDYHSLHHQNDAFQFTPEINGQHLVWRPYPGLPEIHVSMNGTYSHEPTWYRNFLYEQERQRGLDFAEDLASPGVFQWDISQEDAFCIFSTGTANPSAENVMKEELKRRKQFVTRLDFAADAYLVERKKGKTIVAGYPWFTDWGRDTFIALRGLCIARGELKIARDILIEWAQTVSQGMLPNRFPDQGTEAEFNSVDASLWYVIAVYDYFQAAKKVSKADRDQLRNAVDAILTGYENGTRFQIRMDEDGLIAAGQPGYQLTWMDAKVGDWVVTPRIGKPVEIQALWLNALKFAAGYSEHWNELYERGSESFERKFWNQKGGYLFDVVDVDHESGKTDDLFRPNQIFAVGGLPYAVLEGDRARSVVAAVEARLLTPLGLRSLAPESPGYAPHYEGGVRERDGVYHQGTVWPWLMGAFVEAWLRVNGETDEAKREAKKHFLEPLLKHLEEAGLDHISEIVDAEPPYTPRGCPFQAWSVGEALRITKMCS
ncbi:amylo-alpha-1,6-glucosidase [bacterium]|nr:amylo-alpha-1,6-glucosidase [bacterium]MCI0603221.1 amylo-alpha-1,6-glucosidase [bacterium]